MTSLIKYKRTLSTPRPKGIDPQLLQITPREGIDTSKFKIPYIGDFPFPLKFRPSMNIPALMRFRPKADSPQIVLLKIT